jgi:hypothetical protein
MSTRIPSYIALPMIRPMKRYQFRLCATRRVSEVACKNGARRTLDSIGMRIRVQLILLIRQPKAPIGVEDLLAQRREKLLENSAAVDARPR